MRACFKFQSNAFTLKLLLHKNYGVHFWVFDVISLKLKEELIESPNVSSFFFFNSLELIWRTGCVRNNLSHVACSIIYVDADNVCLRHALCYIPCSSHACSTHCVWKRSPRQNEEIITGRQLQNVRYWFISGAFLVPNNVKVTSSILSDALKNIVFPPNQSWIKRGMKFEALLLHLI